MLFLCYRRADGAESADRIREWLEERLGRGQIFMDLYSIYGGDDWRRVVKENLTRSQAVLVIIGPQWLDATLEDEKNASRYEIELALEHHIPIIPVLTRWADMPTADDVPESLKPFTRLNAITVRPAGLGRSSDLDRLRQSLQHHGVHLRPPKVHPQARQLRFMLLEQVRSQINEGKRGALQNLPYIELDISEQPGAVDPPWPPVHPEIGLQQYPVQHGVTPWQILQEHNSLIVLGDPGAGKTTILLDLGEQLLEQAHLDETRQSPIPLYLNLASWSETRQALREWLIERLQQDFGFDTSKGGKLVAGRLVLLLDGLDEVEEQARSACINAINAYQGQHDMRGRMSVVVSCRSDIYFAQATRLRVANAIRVQPLSPDKISAFLEHGSEQLTGLKHAIQQDDGLSELSQSPFWLNLLAVIYRNVPVEQLPEGLATYQLRRELLARYIALRLDGRYRARPQPQSTQGMRERKRLPQDSYAPDDARRWLAWLGHILKSHSLSRFYLESLQPDMAKRPAMVRILYFLVFWLGCTLFLGTTISFVFGLIFDLLNGPALGLQAGLTFGAVFGIASGLYTGIIFGGITGGKITLKDRVHFSLGNIVTGLFGGLFGGITMRFIAGFHVALVGGVLSGIVFGLMFAVVDIVRGSPIDEAGYAYPYVGMQLTGQNGLRFGIFFGLLFGIGGGLAIGLDAGLGGGLLLGVLFGFLCALVAGTIAALFAGLSEYLKHWMLRFVLVRQGAIPPRCLNFLYYASDRAILRQVGNGFEFIHPMLRDYFAWLSDGAEHPAAFIRPGQAAAKV